MTKNLFSPERDHKMILILRHYQRPISKDRCVLVKITYELVLSVIKHKWDSLIGILTATKYPNLHGRRNDDANKRILFQNSLMPHIYKPLLGNNKTAVRLITDRMNSTHYESDFRSLKRVQNASLYDRLVAITV